VNAPSPGVLTRLDALAVGVAAWRLGAGRARKEDPVQAGAGVVMHAKPGDTVVEGQPLLTLLTDDADRFPRARAALQDAYDIEDPTAKDARTQGNLILDRVSSSAGRT
jgi:thymidine phosphorylase